MQADGADVDAAVGHPHAQRLGRQRQRQPRREAEQQHDADARAGVDRERGHQGCEPGCARSRWAGSWGSGGRACGKTQAPIVASQFRRHEAAPAAGSACIRGFPIGSGRATLDKQSVRDYLTVSITLTARMEVDMSAAARTEAGDGTGSGCLRAKQDPLLLLLLQIAARGQEIDFRACGDLHLR